MPSRSAEIVVRLALGVLGLAAVVLIFVIDEATPAWSPVTMILMSLPLAFVGTYGVGAATELRDKPHNRDLLRFRRLGKRGAITPSAGAESPIEMLPFTPPHQAPSARFALHTRNSWIAFGIGLVASLVAWSGAVAAFSRDEPFSDAGFIWILGLPMALILAVRSALRIAFARKPSCGPRDCESFHIL